MKLTYLRNVFEFQNYMHDIIYITDIHVLVK